MKRETKVFALTGNIATGKSTVAWMFEDMGVPVIDADEIAHEALKPHSSAWTALFERYGKKVLLKDNVIDRTRLADIIFSDQRERKYVESLIHPYVRNEIEMKVARLAKENHPFVIVEVPLLFEAGWEKEFDSIIVVRCNAEHEVKRCQEKFGVSRADAMKRMGAQYPLPRKIASADAVIDNDGPIEETKVQVKRLYQEMVRGKI